jgi:putative membrane protein
MIILAKIFTILVALEHFYILYLEMFAWTTPRVRRIFGTTPDFAKASKALAANQGLYNGFLAAGLIWSVVHPDQGVGLQIGFFFLLCVVVAAIFGSLTAKRSILWIQGGPALIALLLSLLVGTVG